MTSIYLRLAAPLQSWAAERVTGNFVYTTAQPTRSALTGLVAAALGARRGEWPSWLADVQFTVRIDQPGAAIDEFQTINPRDEDLEFRRRMYMVITGRAPTYKGITFTPDGQDKTSIVQRTYLENSEFLVRITAEKHFADIDRALRQPVFSPYLGRKAFAPTFPFYLGIGGDEMLTQLPTRRTNAKQALSGEPAPTTRLRVLPLDGLDTNTFQYCTVPVLPPAAWLAHVKEALQRPALV